MALYLARHGQTDWNLERRLQSATDVPLNQTGRGQARRLRSILKARGVVFALGQSSPLERARETMEIVLAGATTAWRVEPRLAEIGLGDFEGEREADLQRRLGSTYTTWREGRFTAAAPNGESLEEAMQRVTPLLSELATAGGDILVVGHQGINMALKAQLSGRLDLAALEDFAQANDEVDVWDLGSRARIERFRLEGSQGADQAG